MNTNKELFFERCKEYFKDDYKEFIKKLEEKPSSGFFLNEKKLNKNEILNIIDFEYKESSLTDKSFYHDYKNIGKTKANELGIIYPQDIESSISASYLDLKDVKYVIDLCAAPGGKSINLLNRLSNDTLMICNDVSYKRASILASNLERLGLDNTIITSLEPSFIASKYESCFDIVVLDAPCSGEGMIRKYPEILDTYNIGNIESLAKTQSDLLECAYKLLKKNGQLIYSTCTYAFEEDENQIKEFLNKYTDMKLIPITIKEKNYSTLDGTIKLCPLNNTEGQFMVLMVKTEGEENNLKFNKTTKNKVVEEFIKDNLNIENYYLYSNENKYYMSFIPLISFSSNVLNQGIYLGELKKDRFEPSHSLYRANSLIGKYKYVYDLNDTEYDSFISGNELHINLEDNYYLITYRNVSLGFGKLSKGTLKNKYPKGLRRMV